MASKLGYVSPFQVTKTNQSRALSEPGIVLNTLPFISSNLHNKPMWVHFTGEEMEAPCG